MADTNTNTSVPVTRKGSGRTKGSFSFTKITLADLNSKFADKTTPIVLSRKWAEQLGFTGLNSISAINTMESIQGVTPATAVAVTATDLGE